MDNGRPRQSPAHEYIFVCSLKIKSRLGDPVSVCAQDSLCHGTVARRPGEEGPASGFDEPTPASGTQDWPLYRPLLMTTCARTNAVPRVLTLFLNLNLGWWVRRQGQFNSPAVKVCVRLEAPSLLVWPPWPPTGFLKPHLLAHMLPLWEHGVLPGH